MNRGDRILLLLCTLLMTLLFYLTFVIIPNERTMGFVQKIFYIHVPCAWVAFLAFGVTGYKGLRYLMTHRMEFDRAAAASAEVGLVFVTLVLITGPIWARPVWGIWWTWDLRLTTTFVLWLLFLAYMVLRNSIEDRGQRATLSSVVGLIAFLDVPVVYLANRVKASQHPAPVMGGGEKSGLSREFAITFAVGLVAMTLVYALLYRLRRDLAQLQDEIEQLAIGALREES
jgi:heme exporter protein C